MQHESLIEPDLKGEWISFSFENCFEQRTQVWARAGKQFRAKLVLAEGRLASSHAPTIARSTQSISRSTIQAKPLKLHPVRANGIKQQAVAFRQPLPLFAPRTIARSTHQVGLNSARNFSSARPVFENITQNVNLLVRAGLHNVDKGKGKDVGIAGARVVKGKGKSKATPCASSYHEL